MNLTKLLVATFIMWMAFFCIGCSKSNNGGTGTTTPPRDTTPIIITPPPPASSYVVKTIGISRIRLALDDNDKLNICELVGGGNRLILKAGSGYQMSFSNPHNYEPSVQTYSDAFPDALYPVVNKTIDNAVQLDTTVISFKFTGFDKAKTGYDQLNVVLCNEVRIAMAGYYFNLNMLRINKKNMAYNNSFYSKVFTTPVNISSLVIAPNVSSSSYIVRDIAAVSHGVTTDINDLATAFNAGDGSGTSIKLRLSNNGALNVGLISTQLVNANKGSFTATDFYSGYFTNIRHGLFGPVSIIEPQDTATNIFVRLTGFNASVLGYNELRVFLVDDGTIGAGAIGINQFRVPPQVLTVPLMQKTFALNNFYCIQSITD